MINNFNCYKGIDISNKDLRYNKKNYLNPYGFNIDSSLKEYNDIEELSFKSKTHNNRKYKK